MAIFADQIRTSVRELFEDVVDEFHELTYIKQQFQKWKQRQNESYTEAYIALCLPKLFTPFVKLKLVDWNPLEVRVTVVLYPQSVDSYGYCRPLFTCCYT